MQKGEVSKRTIVVMVILVCNCVPLSYLTIRRKIIVGKAGYQTYITLWWISLVLMLFTAIAFMAIAYKSFMYLQADQRKNLVFDTAVTIDNYMSGLMNNAEVRSQITALMYGKWDELVAELYNIVYQLEVMEFMRGRFDMRMVQGGEAESERLKQTEQDMCRNAFRVITLLNTADVENTEQIQEEINLCAYRNNILLESEKNMVSSSVNLSDVT